MQLKKITPVIITLNEEPNLERLLSGLVLFPRVILVDSFSQDKTREMAKKFTNTVVLERGFDNFANQWNFGLDNSGTDWVLALDADYRIERDLLIEIDGLPDDPEEQGFMVSFKYAIFGKALRCGIYPSRIIFFRKSASRFFNDGHSQALNPPGLVRGLKNCVIHDDWKDMSRWIENQISYGRMERDKLMSTNAAELTFPDRLRLYFPMAPLAMLVYILIVRKGLFDGWSGIFYALQRVIAELIIGLFILEARLTAAGPTFNGKDQNVHPGA